MKRYSYAAFLAVTEKLRGKGYGQKILTDILEKNKKECPLIAEVESPTQIDAPNLEIRKRRFAFYMRNGIIDTGLQYTRNGVIYNILTTCEKPIPKEDIEELSAILKPLDDIYLTVEH